jgi:hypothetical protein
MRSKQTRPPPGRNRRPVKRFAARLWPEQTWWLGDSVQGNAAEPRAAAAASLRPSGRRERGRVEGAAPGGPSGQGRVCRSISVIAAGSRVACVRRLEAITIGPSVTASGPPSSASGARSSDSRFARGRSSISSVRPCSDEVRKLAAEADRGRSSSMQAGVAAPRRSFALARAACRARRVSGCRCITSAGSHTAASRFTACRRPRRSNARVHAARRER